MNHKESLPKPTQQPEPDEEQTAPTERPKRRRIMQPVFSTRIFNDGRASRLAVTAVALSLTAALWAQNVPTPSTNPTGQGTTTTPQAVTPQRGWTMFDDKVGNEMRMPPEQLNQLRAIDERYMGDYRALGNDPTVNPRYQELTDRRNAEIRKVMNEPMYTTWMNTYQPTPNTIQEQRTGGISTPPPPKP